jgi:hypothetical protein
MPLPPSTGYSGQAAFPVASVPADLRMTATYANKPRGALGICHAKTAALFVANRRTAALFVANRRRMPITETHELRKVFRNAKRTPSVAGQPKPLFTRERVAVEGVTKICSSPPHARAVVLRRSARIWTRWP